MKVLFETVDRQRLEAELTGDNLEKLLHKIGGLCMMVRTMSVKDVNIPEFVKSHLDGFELLVTERQMRR